MKKQPEQNDYQTKIQTASSILRIVLKRKISLSFSIAKFNSHVISFFTVPELITASVMGLVAKTIKTQLMDGMTFFQKYLGV